MPRQRFYLNSPHLQTTHYLTLRQAQALILLITTGDKRQHLAAQMGISPRTLDIHLNAARKQLRCRNLRELILRGQDHPWQQWKVAIQAINPQPAIRQGKNRKMSFES